MALLALAVLCLTCFATRTLAAEAVGNTTPPAPADTVSRLILRDTPLDQVLVLYEQLTGRIVLRPELVASRDITYDLRDPVSMSEAVRALESALEINEIGTEDRVGKYIIVKALVSCANCEPPSFLEGRASDEPTSNMVATKIFELKYFRPGDVAQQLNIFLSPQTGGAAVFANNPSLFMVTDTIANLQRVEHLVDQLDRPTEPTVTTKYYKLQNAPAVALAQKIETLLGLVMHFGGNLLTVSADARTNRLIVVGPKELFGLFDDLVARLDVPPVATVGDHAAPLLDAPTAALGQKLRNDIARLGKTAQPEPAAGTRPDAPLVR